MLFYDEKLLVTKKLILYVLRRLHIQHQGKEKTYKLAKQIFFFPNMKKLIHVMISNCKSCLRYRALPQRELMRHEYMVRPFQQMTMDIFQYGGHLYLAASDKYSNFPLIEKINTTSSNEVLTCVMTWVHLFGYPEVIRSDGARCFDSAAFQLFCADYGIIHQMSSVALVEFRNTPTLYSDLSPNEWV